MRESWAFGVWDWMGDTWLLCLIMLDACVRIYFVLCSVCPTDSNTFNAMSISRSTTHACSIDCGLAVPRFTRPAVACFEPRRSVDYTLHCEHTMAPSFNLGRLHLTVICDPAPHAGRIPCADADAPQ